MAGPQATIQVVMIHEDEPFDLGWNDTIVKMEEVPKKPMLRRLTILRRES